MSNLSATVLLDRSLRHAEVRFDCLPSPAGPVTTYTLTPEELAAECARIDERIKGRVELAVKAPVGVWGR